MPFEFRFDTLDDIPEALRPLAQEVDGKHVLTKLADGFALDNVRALKNKADGEAAERKKLAEILGRYDWAKELEPAAIRDAYERVKAGAVPANEVQKAVDTYKQASEAKWAADLKKLQDALAEKDAHATTLMSQIRDRDFERDVVSAIVEAGGNVKALRPVLRERAKWGKEGDREGWFFYDEKGNLRWREDRPGTEPMSAQHVVAALKSDPDFKHAFSTVGKGGAPPAPPINGPRPGGRPATAPPTSRPIDVENRLLDRWTEEGRESGGKS